MTDEMVEKGPWDGLLAPEWVPTEIDTGRAHPARIYDFLLGGKNNFVSDRAAAEQLLVVRPELRDIVRSNRAFLARAVEYAVRDAGIRQFLDIGTGIPTEGNTHEVAQALDPDCTVAYVDNDPMVLVHSRALMAAGRGHTSIVRGDLRDPEAILAHPDVLAAVDFTRPVALMLVAILHFLSDADRPWDVVARFRDAMAPGSLLILSHGTYNDDEVDEMERFSNVYNQASAEVHSRLPSDVMRFFDGFELVEPGLVVVSDWRPTPDVEPLAAYSVSGLRGGVGVLR